MAHEVVVGMARTAVPAAVGTAVASQDVVLALAATFVTSTWYLVWSWAEAHVDARLGVLLGYASWHEAWVRNEVADLREAGSDVDTQSLRLGLLGQRPGPRHSRARARGESAPLLPRLPRPRREAMLEVVDEL